MRGKKGRKGMRREGGEKEGWEEEWGEEEVFLTFMVISEAHVH